MNRREFIRNTGVAAIGFAVLPEKTVAEPIVFRLGRYYEHTCGSKMHIVASAETRMWGSALLAEERADGTIRPVGRTKVHAVNWYEITATEFEVKEKEDEHEQGNCSSSGRKRCHCVFSY